MPKDDKKDEKEDLVIVGLSKEELESSSEDRPDDAPETPSEKKEKSEAGGESEGSDEHEDESSEDSRLGSGEDETDDEKRERRRGERAERKRRQREFRDRDKKELDFLRRRNEELERRFSAVEGRVAQTETATIDHRISQIKGQLRVADEVEAKAIEKGSGEDAVEARNIRADLEKQLDRLEAAKRVRSERRAESDRDEPAPRIPRKQVELSRAWLDDHSWCDPTDAEDEDSVIVNAIDSALLASGEYDPTSPEYYRELTKRVQRRLPHRFRDGSSEDDDPGAGDRGNGSRERRSPAGGPKFSTGGRERTLRANEVYISPERKRAMEEAGVWDDPVLRGRYLKRYQDYDRENGRSRA